MTLAQQQLGARGLVPVFPPPGGGCEVWVCHQAGVGVAGEGGGALCPHYADSGHCTLPNTGQQGPFRESPPAPSQPSPGSFATKFAHPSAAQGTGGAAAAAVRKNIVVTSVPAFRRLLDNAVVSSGAGPQPGHLNSNVG